MNKQIQIHDGTTVTIRRGTASDAEAVISFCKQLFSVTDQVVTTLAEFDPTIQQEAEFIDSHSDKPGALLLVAECNKEIVGLLNFNCYNKIKMKHAGEFGISVLPNFQGNGIGKAMIGMLIGWAKEQQVEKIFLEVMDTNLQAIRLYYDLGFIEEGKKLRAVRQPDNSYADLVIMGLAV